MSPVEVIVAVSSLLLAGLGVLWQLFAGDLRAWTPELTALLVERAVRKLPEHSRDEQREEWLAELSILPRNAIWTQLGWAWGYGRAAQRIRSGKSENPPRKLPITTPSAAVRQVRAHQADLRLQAWLTGDRRSVEELLSYLTCLVAFEESHFSVGYAARVMRCSEHVIEAGIARLESALEEGLLSDEDPARLTALGEDIAVAARPLVRRVATRDVFEPHGISARVVIDCLAGTYRGSIPALPFSESPLPAMQFADRQLVLFGIPPVGPPRVDPALGGRSWRPRSGASLF